MNKLALKSTERWIVGIALGGAVVLAACGGSTASTTGTTGGGGQSGGTGGVDCSSFMGMMGMAGGGMSTGPSMGAGPPDFSCITAHCATECKDLPMGGGPGAGPGGTGSASGGGVPDLPGGDVYAARSCNGCHGDQGQGTQGPNITPSMTAGVGAWTTQQLTDAIRSGKRIDGKDLCSSMPRWTVKQLSDADLGSLVGFLQALPAIDAPNPGTLCSGGGTGSTSAGGMIPTIDISKECFACLDSNCKDISTILHCFTGQ